MHSALKSTSALKYT